MGFLDKLKEGADQAKELAGQAVDRARDEAKELNLKRQIAGAEGDLGRATFELLEQGAVSHAALSEPAERVRTLRAELTAIQEAQESDGETGESADSAGEEQARTDDAATQAGAGDTASGPGSGTPS
ncbi:MAG: hypothetical protein U0R69_08065 [Gaiellales bacterium]